MPLRLPATFCVLTGLCLLATMTIWMEAGYNETFFQAGVLGLAAVVAMKRAYAVPTKTPRLGWGTLLWVAFLLIGLWGPLQLLAGWTVYAHETWVASLHWTALIATFFVAYDGLASSRSNQRAQAGLAVFGAFMAVFATAQAYTSHGEYYWLFPSGQELVFGPIQNRNHYAAFIELTLPLTLWEGLKSRRYRAIWLAAAGVMAASVVACASRAGSALIAVEIPAVFVAAYFTPQFSRRQAAIVAAQLTVVAGLAVAATGWDTLARRAAMLDPLLYRREMMSSSIAMARDRPWTGFGLGTFPTVYPAYATFDSGYLVNHAHNDWTEWGAEGGWLFLTVLGSIAAVGAMLAVRSGWGLGLVAVFLHATVDFPLQRTGSVVWVVMVGAMLAADRTASRRASLETAAGSLNASSVVPQMATGVHH